MFPYCKLVESEVFAYLESVNDSAVTTSLNKSTLTMTDFINLLSPAAARHIETMRAKARFIKKRHFGDTVRFYSPLYISNYCSNECVYCGFRSKHNAERRRLSIDEIIREGKEIKRQGIDSLLLVSGEDPHKVSVEFLEKAVSALKELFSYVSIEIFPLSLDGYRRLFRAGVHGMILYQETYDRELYEKLHLKGSKTNYLSRFDHVENAAKAGLYNIGLGALLGLHDWRSEAASMAAHALWLKKRYWRSRVQLSFPRITPVPGSFQVPAPVSEDHLEQMALAFRIFFQEADISISTRENSAFRDRAAVNFASHISAGSCVIPGGYTEQEADDLGQFTLNDTRSVEQMREDMKRLGLEIVLKDWDLCLGAGG